MQPLRRAPDGDTNAENAYDYAGQDPINGYDLTGEFLAGAKPSDVKAVAKARTQIITTPTTMASAPTGGNTSDSGASDAEGTPSTDDIGTTWPVQGEDGDCTDCAAIIQGILGGGDIVTIKPDPDVVPGVDNPSLGPSVGDPEGDWFFHDVVVQGGRVFDGVTTGEEGMWIDEFKDQFTHPDGIIFGF
jgi:hypothetical protein